MTDKVAAAFANEVTQEEMNEWYALQKEIEDKKAREMYLRLKIFNAKFTNPKEGVNDFALQEGWILKGDYKINRKVDLPIYANLKMELAEQNLPLDELIEYKPELRVGVYKKLTEEQRKSFDRVLEIKPGTPALKIVLPKKVKQ